MSADIIQFVPRPRRDRAAADFSPIAFRSMPRPDDLTMDHVDTAPCEYCWQTEKENAPPHTTFP